MEKAMRGTVSFILFSHTELKHMFIYTLRVRRHTYHVLVYI